MELEDMVSKKEAAKLLRVSDYTISAWLTKKRLRKIKVGRRTMLSKKDLESFVRSQNAA